MIPNPKPLMSVIWLQWGEQMHSQFTLVGLIKGGVETPNYVATVSIAVADADRLYNIM